MGEASPGGHFCLTMTPQNYDPLSGAGERPGVLVPPTVIDQLDKCLPSLYGLIESAIQLMQELPPGIEVTLIRAGLVETFFQLYHILNDTQIIFLTGFDANVRADA